MKKAYDLFVIGAGSGGVRAARVAAGLGASVAVAEVGALGGTCVNVGCVPKKLMVYASEVSAQVADAAGFGWSIEGAAFDWPVLLANKNREIERLNGVYRSLLEKSGVTIVHGRAALADPHTIDVDGASYSAGHVLLATGGRPTVPEFPGSEHAITSDDVFFLEKQPERVVVVGGGYIAVEFAGIFQGLGSEVTQLYRGPLFLRGFDADIRQHLATQMRSRGIDLRFESNVQAIEKQGDRLKLTLTDEGVMEADCVLYATGRRPNTAGLGLEACGVKLGERGEVIVDEHSRSSVSDIFAVGDCTDRVNLTPVALAEGSAVARTLFAQEPTRVSYENVPTAVFSQPPVATVGLGEEAARRTLDGVQVYRSRFRPMKNTVSERDEQALIKVVVEEASQRVVGVHMVGADAGEIIQGLAVAVVAGVTKAQLDQTIGIHPTTAEEFVTLREPVA